MTTSRRLGSNWMTRTSQGSALVTSCPGGVGGAFAVGLVPGHDVPGHEVIAGQAGLVTQAEEVRGRSVVVVGGDEPRTARGCGHAAGVFEQEQHASAGAAPIWVEPGREVCVTPGVDLFDQPVQRRHMGIVDPPLLVRDDIIEAVRLGQEWSRVGDHLYRMTEWQRDRGYSR